jgi:hypothetical protein
LGAQKPENQEPLTPNLDLRINKSRKRAGLACPHFTSVSFILSLSLLQSSWVPGRAELIFTTREGAASQETTLHVGAITCQDEPVLEAEVIISWEPDCSPKVMTAVTTSPQLLTEPGLR